MISSHPEWARGRAETNYINQLKVEIEIISYVLHLSGALYRPNLTNDKIKNFGPDTRSICNLNR